mmetsp:Transcript_1271/g.3541  ORF Transcript_1271/g.3541 Transcript_1271/m.3541 type:complete len:82 (+) Transcript_1271:180-425(+)
MNRFAGVVTERAGGARPAELAELEGKKKQPSKKMLILSIAYKLEKCKSIEGDALALFKQYALTKMSVLREHMIRIRELRDR